MLNNGDSQTDTSSHTFSLETVNTMKLLIIFISLGVSILAGCAASQKDQLLEAGKEQLDHAQLSQLLNSHVLRLETIDFDANLTFFTDGHLEATGRSGASDKGKWIINEQNRLCLKFSAWYFGDLHCYDVIEEAPGEYALFTANGARAYSATALGGKSQEEATTSQQEAKENRHNTPKITKAPVPPRPTNPQDTKRTLSNLAANCPGCNFAEADLQDASLIAANLANADLRAANLTGANLRRANLSGADLSQARLRHTNLAGANLQNAILTGADLSGANLIKADLTNAQYTNANFSGAYLEGIKGYTETK